MKKNRIRRVARRILIFALIVSITIIGAYAEGNQSGIPLKIGGAAIYIDVTNIVQAIFYLAVAIFTSIVAPLLKLLIGQKLVKAGVLAAEQLLGSGVGKEKYDYVVNWVSRLIKLDEQTLQNFIEAAVREMKNALLENKNE